MDVISNLLVGFEFFQVSLAFYLFNNKCGHLLLHSLAYSFAGVYGLVEARAVAITSHFMQALEYVQLYICLPAVSAYF